ncbi:amino acid permease [Candidatus Sulfidibacterium hydrothermale]|uniref:amino acid permease n=1 Tax=Candidatus Sulfidibacterium hydrothermale TaxID=2875962 RepID=UPI001F0A3C53|nr:amino acid permease [Candidatus Sulfidibacterium hydrothermale]UBM63290.1 amino acid permease [Candidatus Sulfidibacterium hydrothermale]
MVNDIQEIFYKKIKPPNFERTMGLFGATTIGVGALMGAGVYVLIGAAAGVAGPSVILTYLITGILAFATTLMFAELGRLIPRSGGGYTYAYNILGSLGGFATGWFLALGSIFACGLYAIGFAEYTISITGLKVPDIVAKAIAIGITLLLALMNSFSSGKKKFNLQNWIVWGNLAILLILIVFSAFHGRVENLKPFFPKGVGGTFAAISLIYISFFGYQLVANNADEIIEPEKTVPKAMKLSMLISMSVYLFIAVAAVMTVPWDELAKSHAPLVLLADKSFGGRGWLLVSIGGIMASLGALSSTMISQSRQTYEMGKDRFLPDFLGILDEKTRQPKMALLLGAVVISLILITADLEFIAKAANFCLLASLLPVSLALRKIYRKNPAMKPKAAWKNLLPELTLVINLGLLLTLGVVSLAFGQQLLLVGAVVYFFYSRKREKRHREGLNIILEEEKGFSFFRKNTVLVPMSNPKTQEALLMLSNRLMARQGGEIIVLAVKDVPEGVDFYEALSEAEKSLEVIKRSVKLAEKNKIKIKPIIRAARSVPKGIVQAGESENSDLIIMGFPKKFTPGKPSILSQVMRLSVTDMVVVNLKTSTENFHPKRIAIYVKNASDLNLMLNCATAIAEFRGARIVLLKFLPLNYSMRQKQWADKLIVQAIENFNSSALYDISLIPTSHPKEELLKYSERVDLLIIGTDKRLQSAKAIEESEPFRIAEQAACSVLMVKSVSKLKRLVSKL